MTNKDSLNEHPLLLGVCGVARCGKDTFFSFASRELESAGIRCERVAFADALKEDLDFFLKDKLSISSFTTNDDEKALIRPIMVSYGKALREKTKGVYWINKIKEKVEENINNQICSIITDVRYSNELEWIHGHSRSETIYIERKGLSPANKEEEENDWALRQLSRARISWETFGNENLSLCEPTVSKYIKERFGL